MASVQHAVASGAHHPEQERHPWALIVVHVQQLRQLVFVILREMQPTAVRSSVIPVTVTRSRPSGTHACHSLRLAALTRTLARSLLATFSCSRTRQGQGNGRYSCAGGAKPTQGAAASATKVEPSAHPKFVTRMSRGDAAASMRGRPMARMRAKSSHR